MCAKNEQESDARFETDPARLHVLLDLILNSGHHGVIEAIRGDLTILARSVALLKRVINEERAAE